LDRQEALTLIHEIHNACKESVIIHSISLDFRNPVSKEEYLIRMKTELDNYAKECFNPILKKHQLVMREENGYVIIFRMHSIN
jgi:hypothetical protein